jgi:hypothetical protein
LGQQGDDALGDLFIDTSIHGISFPAVQPAEAGIASVNGRLAASADGGRQQTGSW